MQSPLNNTQFSLSVDKVSQFPGDEGVEVAFIGRSNVGKSSIINAICGRKSLAKKSKTPGCTTLLNVFEIDDQRRLIDCPGYGYAKVSKQQAIAWQRRFSRYIESRQSLHGLIQIMDARHPLMAQDRLMLDLVTAQGLAVHVLLNKCDKLSRSQGMRVLQDTSRQLADDYRQVSLQLFSATRPSGVQQAQQRLHEWLNIEQKKAPETRGK